ncbi:MAG: J domain-containing protein, partial [Thermoanaerobaculia bacterium]
MKLDDCYRTLEVPPGASFEEVRRAHRDLAKVWHPDRFGHDAALRARAEEKLKAINEAWETICAAGDRTGWNGPTGTEAPPAREPDPAELARMRM